MVLVLFLKFPIPKGEAFAYNWWVLHSLVPRRHQPRGTERAVACLELAGSQCAPLI